MCVSHLQDRKKLLKDWVLKNGDAAQIEAEILLSRSNRSKFGKQRELLTVSEMLAKGFPREKIDAVTAKGGIPDEDVPHLTSLYRYWVTTSSVITDEEEVKQEATMKIAADANASALGAVLSGPTAAGNLQALPAGGMDAIMQQLQVSQQGLHAFGCMLCVGSFLPYRYLWLFSSIAFATSGSAPVNPKAKGKAKAKAKAKSHATPNVQEVGTKTVDDLRSELRSYLSCFLQKCLFT